MEVNNLFFLNPMRKYGVRELSRITKKDTKTIMKYLSELCKRKIITKKKEKGKFPYYEANRTSYIYRHEKSEVLIKKIIQSGLIEYLEKELSPKAIVLFGSIQKGTYHKESDIDIFVQTKQKRLNLEKFRKKINHSVNILFEPDIFQLTKGLRGNIYNGLVLVGRLETL